VFPASHIEAEWTSLFIAVGNGGHCTDDDKRNNAVNHIHSPDLNSRDTENHPSLFMLHLRESLHVLIRLVWLLCSMTAVIAASLIITALRLSLQHTVEARKFMLRDSLSRVQAELSVDATANASLFFVDSLGQKEVVLK
jgi:hypothetical protein